MTSVRVAVLLGLLVPAAWGQDSAENNDRNLFPYRLVLRAGTWDTRQPVPDPALTFAQPEDAAAAGYYLVQAAPGRMRALRREVAARAGLVFDYVPNNAFEVKLPPAAAGALRALGYPVLPVHPGWKLPPELGSYGTDAADPRGRLRLAIEAWPDQDLGALEAALAELGAAVRERADAGRYQRLLALVPAERLAAVARLPLVKWIEEDAPGAARNDRTRWIIQTNQVNDVKLWQRGLTGAGVTIGHIDAGLLFEQSCYFKDPSGASPGPSHRKIKWWSGGAGADPHATHTAGAAAGDSTPINGSLFRAGMAPEAFLVHHGFLPSSAGLLSMLLQADGQGARIHSNSWGNDFTRQYDNWCRDIDAYAHDHEDALVIFSVSNGNLVKNPENAKSACAVAATQRDDPEQHGSGGHGPTLDGRLKPEVMAPGCSTFSAAAGANCLTVPDCGTSMAAPVVAGGGALLKQYFEDGFYPSGAANPADAFTPSGSLLRACLANCGDDLSAFAGYPTQDEGWGRILLDDVAYFAGDTRRLALLDRRHVQGLQAGQRRNYRLSVAGGGPLRVTLAWADEPGSAMAADPVVNNLNLIVTAPDGTRYHGNVLDEATGKWVPDTQRRDQKNSLETVLVPNPTAGSWTIAVEGQDVPVGPQGYAVVATF